MPSSVVGLHHVTAIASDPQRNLDFYTQVLGLRFVKRTVNFDDPGTYHLYFGDDAGSPGTILTFFPWPHASPGHSGAGEVTKTAFSVPAGSFGFWQDRLADEGIAVEHTGNRFEEDVLTFADPDGMKLEDRSPRRCRTTECSAFCLGAPRACDPRFFRRHTAGTWTRPDGRHTECDGVSQNRRGGEPAAFLSRGSGAWKSYRSARRSEG